MPAYDYQCPEHKDEITEVIHGFHDNVVIECPRPDCRREMRRMLPRRVRFYMNPGEVLYDYMDKKFQNSRGNRKERHRGRRNKSTTGIKT